MSDRNKLGHTEEDVLIKRVSTELQAFIEMDPRLEDRVMDELKKPEVDSKKPKPPV